MMGFAALCPSYEFARRVENLRAARAFRGLVDQGERFLAQGPQCWRLSGLCYGSRQSQTPLPSSGGVLLLPSFTKDMYSLSLPAKRTET